MPWTKPKTGKILWLCLSLLIPIFSSCGTAKKITVCVSDEAKGAVVCSKAGGKSFDVPYDQTDGYISLPPADAETLFTICKLKTGGSKKSLTFCVASVSDHGLQCSKGGLEPFFVGFNESDGFIGFPAKDAELVFKICKLGQ